MEKEKNNRYLKRKYQLSPIELTLGQICGVYPSLQNIVDLSSNLEYLLESVKEIAPEHYCQWLQLHPFTVIENGSRYYCVTHIRQFQTAKILLTDTHAISCRCLVGVDEEEVRYIGQTDFYLSTLLLSLRPQDVEVQACRLWEGDAFDTDLKRAVTPTIRHQAVLARMLNTTRSQVYLRRKTNGKRQNDIGKT